MDELATWVTRVQRTGDVAAFTALVGRFQELAFAVAMHRLGDAAAAEDACQDAFLTAYLEIDRVTEPAAFPGWFRRVVFTRADRIGRRKQPIPAGDALPDVHDAGGVAEAQDTSASVAGLRAKTAWRALDALPERDRLILATYYTSGRSIREIAAFLDLSEPLVKKTLQRARAALREEVDAMTKRDDQNTTPPKTPNPRLEERVAFFLHLRRGDHDEVRRALVRDPALVNSCDLPDADPARWYMPALGRATPLLWAIDAGDVALCTMLIEQGADVNQPSTSGTTPLMEAVILGFHELAALLLDYGASPHAAYPRSGMTPLHVAVSRRDTGMVRLLCARGADPTRPDHHGRTPRDWATLKGFLFTPPPRGDLPE